MRFAPAILAILLALTALPAKTCLGQMQESTLFFETVPEAIAASDVIAEVEIEKLKGDILPETATVRVLKVRRGTMKEGEKAVLNYSVSSCGPNQKVGEKGLIIAQKITGENGEPALRPYMRRFSDDRIEPAPPVTK
jgi:hypothetical protein